VQYLVYIENEKRQPVLLYTLIENWKQYPYTPNTIINTNTNTDIDTRIDNSIDTNTSIMVLYVNMSISVIVYKVRHVSVYNT